MANENQQVIGVFGGSFNPPHRGHRQVITELLARQLVDEIWILPCGQHAFGKIMTDNQKRVDWLEKLMTSLPPSLRARVRLETCELTTDEVSYTYRTLTKLRARYPKYNFQFVIGSDQVADFPKWDEYQQLLTEFPVLVYPRQPDLQPKLLTGMTFLTDFPTVDISSTQIRAWQAAGDPRWRELVIN